MAIEADVMELVRILDEEGFGWLGGELLAEISLGRERPAERYEKPYSADDQSAIFDDEQPTAREEIPEGEQVAEAVRILRLKLVEPVRALAEAETICGALAGTKPIRIAFVDDDGEPDPRFETQAVAGDAGIAEKMDGILTRLLAAPRVQEV